MMRAVPSFTFPTIKSVVNVVTNISATKYTNTKIGNAKIIIPSLPDNSSKSRKGKICLLRFVTQTLLYVLFSLLKILLEWLLSRLSDDAIIIYVKLFLLAFFYVPFCYPITYNQ